MFGQSKEGWRELRKLEDRRTVVLRADADTLESIRLSGHMKLRLICEQGSSMLLHLEQGGCEWRAGDGKCLLVTLMVPNSRILECTDAGLDIIFWDRETREGVSFSVKGISQDGWMGGIKPLAEQRQ